MSIEKIKENIYQPKGNENEEFLKLEAEIKELEAEIGKHHILHQKFSQEIDSQVNEKKDLQDKIKYIEGQLELYSKSKEHASSLERGLEVLTNKIDNLSLELDEKLKLQNKSIDIENSLVFTKERLFVAKKIIEERILGFKNKLLSLSKEKEN